MKPRFTTKLNRLFLVLAGFFPAAAGADTIPAHTADARFDTNNTGALTGGPSESSNSDLYVGRQYYSSVANHMVVPFQLPDLGPGTFSGVSVTFRTNDIDVANRVNLHATAAPRASSAPVGTDVRGTSDHRTHGVLIMPDFLTATSTANTTYTTPVNGVVDVALGNWLNTAYSNGANGGQFVFMRLSPNALYPTSDQRGFRIASGNNPDTSKRPFLTYTFNSTGSPPPRINSFSASPTILTPGDSSVIAWDVVNADTVTISGGIGTVGLSGSTEVAPTSTTVYTLTATGTGGTRTATVTVGKAGQVFHRYFRFTPTKLRNDAAANSIQLAEFEMIKNGIRLTGATASNPGGNSPGGESPAQGVDNNPGSKWLDFNKKALVLDYGTVVNADGYRFATANDGEERDPVSWKVEGSNDNTTWTLLDEKFDYATPNARQTYTGNFVVLEPPSTATPSIAIFTASPAAIATGNSSTLSWTVLNANTVSINQGIGTVAAQATRSVSPTATTTYTLTATNANGTATANVTVTVIANGEFRYFRFTPTAFRADDNSVQLAEFEITVGGTRLPGAVASNPGGDNPGNETPAQCVDNNLNTKWLDFNKGPLVMDFGTPQFADGYRFATANDSDGRDPVSWQVHGSVNGTDWILLDTQTDYATPTARQTYLPILPLNTGGPPVGIPQITSFTATPGAIASGASTILAWQVTNATSVSINQGVGTVGLTGSQEVTPSATVTYTLTAVGTGGTRTRTVQVFVATGGLQGNTYDTLEGDQLLDPIATLIGAPADGSFVQAGEIAYENNFHTTLPGLTSGDSFAVLWQGWFDVRVDGHGEYTFGTESDDGSVIYLDLNNDGDFADAGELVVSNLGYHPKNIQTGTVDLQMDTVRIAIGFFEGGGGEAMHARFKKGTGHTFANLTPIGGFTGHFNPTNPGSPTQGVYSITGITRSQDGTTVSLTWESVAGAAYTIQRSPSMTTGTWQDVKTNIAGQAGSTTDNAPSGGGEKQFFRIKRQ